MCPGSGQITRFVPFFPLVSYLLSPHNRRMAILTGKTALFLLVLLSILCLSIVLWPTNPTPIRTILGMEDCRTPCLLGIQLGRTTEAQVMQALESHPWVRTVIQSSGRDPANSLFTWEWWNGGGGELYTTDGIARFATYEAPFALGELWLEMGAPNQRYTSFPILGMMQFYEESVLYNEQQMLVTLRSRMPLSAANYWHSSLEISVSQVQYTMPGPQPYVLPCWSPRCT
jgi:hypothetical protein